MSAAGETKSSRGPKGAAPRESGRPTRQCFDLDSRRKDGRAMSSAGETKSSRGPKGAAPRESGTPTRERFDLDSRLQEAER